MIKFIIAVFNKIFCLLGAHTWVKCYYFDDDNEPHEEYRCFYCGKILKSYTDE